MPIWQRHMSFNKSAAAHMQLVNLDNGNQVLTERKNAQPLPSHNASQHKRFNEMLPIFVVCSLVHSALLHPSRTAFEYTIFAPSSFNVKSKMLALSICAREYHRTLRSNRKSFASIQNSNIFTNFLLLFLPAHCSLLA